MSLQDSLKELESFLRGCQYINLLVAAKQESSKDPLIQRLNLHEDVADEFRGSLQRFLEKTLLDLRLSEYDPSYKPDDNEFCFLNFEKKPEIAKLVEVISQIEQPELFSERDEVIDNLRFYTVICTDASHRKSIFFRTYSPKKELTRRGVFALMMNKGQYNIINNKIFLFDEDVDCFTWNGFLFIKNIHHFRRIFNYFEEIRDKADETIKVITSKIPIDNLDEFKNACTSQLSMMDKLARIADKPYLQSITMTSILQTIKKFKLDIKVVGKNKNAKLLFESHPTKRWLILKLLDDDYLGSTMTKVNYEVNSKKAISG